MVATLAVKQRCGRCGIHGCGEIAVRLSAEDRDQLERLIRSGQRSARVINRARILLKTDEGWSPFQAAAALDTSPRTVFRTKRRYAEEGLDGVLYDHPQANRYRKLDDRGEALLIALACSDAPEGHDHWTLRLLADKVVELGLVVSLSHETVRLNSKKHPPALAEAAVGHLPDERGVCGGHGGRARPVRRTLRPPGRWCASTRPPPSCWPRSGSRCLLNRDDRGGRTMSIGAAAPAICSWPVNPWLAPRGDHGTTHHAGLRPPDAVAD